RLLETYMRERQTGETKANFDVYTNDLERAQYTAEAALIQFEADLESKQKTFKVASDQYEKLLRQIKECTIVAPRDGLVVYANSRQQGQRGGQNESAMIFEGAKVRERQPIINLPDVTNMQVNARIH